MTAPLTDHPKRPCIVCGRDTRSDLLLCASHFSEAVLIMITRREPVTRTDLN